MIYSTVKKDTVPVTHSREQFITQLRAITSRKENLLRQATSYDIV